MSTSSSASKPSKGWQPPTLEEMQAMLPQYRFVSLLGRGGMGAVYKAVQTSLDREVAVKVLPGDLIDDTDAQFAERFKNEARTMAKMNHPAIVSLWDFGETSTGLLFIVMEFIDGTDVSAMIISQGRLPEDYALSITAHVCDALQYAHSHGVIHRDIKPANILINMDGAVKVADFGLAKQSDAGLSGLTKTNMAMGTPDFVAPEALSPGTVVDGRADLYAVGVMLFQMLSGEIPRGMWTLPGAKIGTDPRFDAIINKAMQPDRELRYQTAAEIRADLNAIFVTPRAIMEQQAAQAANAPASQTSAITQDMPSQKPTGQRPQTQGPRRAQAAASSSQLPVRRKSGNALFYGMVAAVVIILGLVVLLSEGRKSEPKPPAVAVTPEDKAGSDKVRPATSPVVQPPAAVAKPTTGGAQRNSIPAAESVNLLAGVDVKQGALKGEWEMTSEGLLSRPSQIAQVFEFQHVPPDEYDFEIEFTPKRGSMEAMQVIPVQGRSLLWKMGTGGGDRWVHVFGPVMDGKRAREDAARTEARVPLPRFVPGERHRSLLEVRKSSLRVILDGKEIMKWSGDMDRFRGESVFDLSDPAHLGLASWSTEVVFHKAEMRKPVAPSAVVALPSQPKAVAPPPSPVSKGKDIPLAERRTQLATPLSAGNSDVLAAVKELPASDTFVWERTPAGLAVRFLKDPGPYKSCVALPVELSPDYAVEVWFTIPQAGEHVGVIVPVGDGRQTTCWIWPGDGDWAGLGKVDGHDPQSPEMDKSCTSPFQLPANELTHLRAEVRRTPGNAEILFSLNGLTMAHYKGPTSRLNMSTAWSIEPQPEMVQIGARQATFHRVIIKSLDREAEERARIIAADPHLTKLDSGFKQRCEIDAQKPYEAGVSALNSSYIEKGLSRALAKAEAGGRSAEVAALKNEKTAIENGQRLPAEDAANTPDALKALRDTYRAALAKLESERDATVTALRNVYLKALDAHVVELTKAGRIPDAEQAQALREALAKMQAADLVGSRSL
ncbi:MAG: protein kinase [Prosthecobacter sp.]